MSSGIAIFVTVLAFSFLVLAVSSTHPHHARSGTSSFALTTDVNGTTNAASPPPPSPPPSTAGINPDPEPSSPGSFPMASDATSPPLSTAGTNPNPKPSPPGRFPIASDATSPPTAGTNPDPEAPSPGTFPMASNATSPPPPSPPPLTAVTDPDPKPFSPGRFPMATEFLTAHNIVRAIYSQTSLQWDKKLARYARRWANERINDCLLQHSPHSPYGENMFWSQKGHWTPTDVVRCWAEESKYYDSQTNQCINDTVCGHYTQIVWHDTQRLGCAHVECNDNKGFLYVCSYDPPGNYYFEGPFGGQFNNSIVNPPSPHPSHPPPPPPPASS